MANLDGLSCALCFDRYTDKEQLPIGLECGHTFCKSCLILGNIVACPTCRATMTKPVSQLRPNYGVLDALQHALRHVRDASSADIVQQSLPARVGRMGVSGSSRFVLLPSSVVEVRLPSILISVIRALLGRVMWQPIGALLQLRRRLCSAYSAPLPPHMQMAGADYR